MQAHCRNYEHGNGDAAAENRAAAAPLLAFRENGREYEHG
jgi:hypothetical protein